jgi:hypothetical protein
MEEAPEMSPKPRHTLRSLAAALCACALVAAGCGGNSEYKDKVNDAAKEFKQTSQAAAGKMRSSKSEGQYLKAAAQFERSIKTLTARLEKLKPPKEAKAAHARLIEVLKDFGRDVHGIRAARKKGDIQTIHKLEGKIVADVGAVQAAQKELDDAVG